MTLDQFAQVGAIVSSVAVVASLVYLAMQIRQNNEQLAAQSRAAYYQGRADTDRDVALNESLAETLLKKVTGDLLTPVEDYRVSCLCWGNLVLFEYEFMELERGLISEREFNIEAKREACNAIRAAIEPVWMAYRKTAPDGFVQLMEQKILR